MSVETKSYWDRIVRSRKSRRSLLGTGFALATSVAALSLAGCGDEDDKTPAQQGLLTPLKDRSSEAIRGGTLNTNFNDPPSLDPLSTQNTASRILGCVYYNRIFQAKPGILEPSQGEIVGDAAESYEQSPDGLQLTVKVRKNLGTDPRPPVNGRALDAQDVLWSWSRWSQVNSLRSTLVNSIDPNAPVASVTAPDPSTVVVKLAFPTILILGYLTDGLFFWVVPREAENRYDPRNEAHGAGPWYLDSYQAGSYARMKRNPNYYEARLPYMDEINASAVIEPAAALAQFEAKQLDVSASFANAGVTNDNVADVYKRHPEMTLIGEPGGVSGRHYRVGYAGASIFKDVRMRRAISMAMNRDELAEYFTSASALSQAGLPSDPVRAAHMLTGFPVAIDPRKKEFGPNAVYLDYNLAEAKKLVQAAGMTDTAFDVVTSNFNRQSEKDGEVMAGQLRQAGFKINEKIVDQNSYYGPKVFRSRGDYEGLAVANQTSHFSPEAFIYSNFHPTPETTSAPPGQFPELTRMIDAILKEVDARKRHSMIQDWIRQAASDMPSIPVGSVGQNYSLAWPWVANYGVFKRWLGASAAGVEVWRHYWRDKSKAT